VPSLGSNFFSQAISLTSSGGASTVEQCADRSIVENNKFEGISTAMVPREGSMGETYNEEVILHRDPIQLSLGDCSDVIGNEFRDLSGADLRIYAGKVRGNLFKSLSLTQGATIVSNELVENTFIDVNLAGYEQQWASALGSKQEGAVVTLGKYLLSLDEPVQIARNYFLNLRGSVEVQSSVEFVGNVLFDVKDQCAATFTSADQIEIRSSTLTRSGRSGICIVLDGRPDAKLNVVNNIVWPLPNAGIGTDIERIGYGLQSTLKNNIYQTASELWDVSEGNIQADPGFFDTEAGDLHVVEGSIAINAGIEDGFFSSSDLDIDGNARVLDGAIDIGAFERSAAALHPADTNGDSSISSAEFEAYNSAWRNNEIWSVAPETIPVDFVTRAGYLLQKGGAYKNIGVGKPATWVPIDE